MYRFIWSAILPEEMTGTERKYLNEYHHMVYDTVEPYLTDAERGMAERRYPGNIEIVSVQQFLPLAEIAVKICIITEKRQKNPTKNIDFRK